jgi:hypothetical protein
LPVTVLDDIIAKDLVHSNNLTQTKESIKAGNRHDELNVSNKEVQITSSSHCNKNEPSICDLLDEQYKEIAFDPDTPVVSPPTCTPNDICQKEHDYPSSKSVVYSDIWLAYGLQHSFRWEFELEVGPKDNTTVDNRLGYDVMMMMMFI